MNKTRHIKYKKLLAIVILLLAYLLPPYISAKGTAITAIPFQKGMCFATWEKDRFASTYSDQALEMLRDMGVEYVQINVTQYQKTFDSTEISPSELTASDSSLKHAISSAHKLGLKTMLKPHIDLLDNGDGTYWRADIGFNNDEDWNKWFKEYEKFIIHYAEMAEKLDVEIFSVGTELSFASQKTDYWRKLIKTVRGTYAGKLIYAANWDDYKNVAFWDDLDMAGIDAYFPLSYSPNPTLDDLKKGWEKWKQEIEEWHEMVNKPVVFTEIGYSSSSTAASEPYKFETRGNADVGLQAKCYSAFFETIWGSYWLYGVYWWKWAPSVNGGGDNNRSFTPLNKPAAKILAKFYLSNTKNIYENYLNKEVETKLDIMAKKEAERKLFRYGIKEEPKQFIRMEERNQ